MGVLTPEFVATIGLLLGVLGRTALPYLRKMWLGEIKDFQIYYIWQGIAAFILSLIVVVLIVPDVLINPTATFLQLMGANFLIGFGSTSLTNEIFALRDLKKDNTEPAPTT